MRKMSWQHLLKYLDNQATSIENQDLDKKIKTLPDSEQVEIVPLNVVRGLIYEIIIGDIEIEEPKSPQSEDTKEEKHE